MLLRAATEIALELKPCMNINLSYDMKIEHLCCAGFFLLTGRITKETVEIIVWVLSLLHFVTPSGRLWTDCSG